MNKKIETILLCIVLIGVLFIGRELTIVNKLLIGHKGIIIGQRLKILNQQKLIQEQRACLERKVK